MSRIDRNYSVRRAFAAAALAVAVIVTGATMSAEARSITGATVSKSGSATILNVTFEAGSPGDSHALYLAYAPLDMGTSIADWPVFQRVKIVGADETSAAVVPQFIGDGNTVCRAFLVENAYPFDRLVESIRQSSAKTQYIDTEFYPGPKTFAALDFKLDNASTTQQRLFGVSGDATANFAFDAYINGSKYWASACADGGGDFLQAAKTAATTDRYTVSLDANTGDHTIIKHSNHSKINKTRSTTRTKTSAGTLSILCQHKFYPSGTPTQENFAVGGLIYGGAIIDNDVPVHTYFPCALGSRAGLYDAVSGRIFWSAVANDDFTVEGASALCESAAGETQVFASAASDIIPPTVPVCAIPVSEYAQAGSGDFLAHFDGLENAGAGAHRTNPSTWADLTGNIALRKTGTAGFTADAWTPNASSYFMGNSGAVKNALGGASPAFTLEMVISHLEETTNAAHSAEIWFWSGSSGNTRQLSLEERSWEGNGTPLVTVLQYRHSDWDAGNFIPAENLTKWGERQYVAIVCDGRTATLYCDGNKYLNSMSGDVDPVSDLFVIGANYNGGGKLMNGSEICAVRMTSRVLTDDERMQNWFVDSQRFGMICAGWVTDKVFKGRGCRTGVFFMLFAALFAFGFWSLPGGAPVWQATLLLMGAGFCIYGPQALTGIIVANQATKEAAALATGFAGIMGYLSTTVSGIGIAFIKERFGWGVALCSIAAFAIVGMVLFLCAWSAKADGYGANAR